MNRNLEVTSRTGAQAWTPTTALDTVVFADRVVGPMGLPLSSLDSGPDGDADSEYGYGYELRGEGECGYRYPMVRVAHRRKWAA